MNITFRIFLYFTLSAFVVTKSVAIALPFMPFSGLLDNTAKEIFEEFVSKLSAILPLGDDIMGEECCFNESLGISKSDLAEKMKEGLSIITEKIKEDITSGKILRKGKLFKPEEVKEKLKGLKIGIGSRAQDLLSLIKDNADSFYKTVIDKFHRKKRSTDIRTEIERLLLKFLQKLLVEKFGLMMIRGVIEDIIEKTPLGKKLFNNNYSIESTSSKGLLPTLFLPYKDEISNLMQPLHKLLPDLLLL